MHGKFHLTFIPIVLEKEISTLPYLGWTVFLHKCPSWKIYILFCLDILGCIKGTLNGKIDII